MSQMEYGKPETTENKPLEKVETFEQEVPESPPVEDASGESEIGKNGFTEADADVDLSRDAAPDRQESAKINQIERINGHLPRNCEYAGQKYPLENLSPAVREKYPESVQFNEKGFPDFSPYAAAEVQISYTGDREKDFKLANQAAGLEVKPKDFTWHHHQDAKTMQLVPRDLHREVGHTGGCATSEFDYN